MNLCHSRGLLWRFMRSIQREAISCGISRSERLISKRMFGTNLNVNLAKTLHAVYHKSSNVKNGFLHFYTSCKVGCDFFGPKHPNVRAKLVEFATFTQQIGIAQLSQRILNGDNGLAECEDLLQDLLAGLRLTAGVSVEEWVKYEEFVDID